MKAFIEGVVIAIAISGAIFALALSFSDQGYSAGKEAMKQEAAKMGYAEYVTGDKGESIWQWRQLPDVLVNGPEKQATKEVADEK